MHTHANGENAHQENRTYNIFSYFPLLFFPYCFFLHLFNTCFTTQYYYVVVVLYTLFGFSLYLCFTTIIISSYASLAAFTIDQPTIQPASHSVLCCYCFLVVYFLCVLYVFESCLQYSAAYCTFSSFMKKNIYETESLTLSLFLCASSLMPQKLAFSFALPLTHCVA